MKLGVMQPYFFPYLGYFSLIRHSDRLILLDTVQFMRHGWIERNRILKPDAGWQYVAVPLEKHGVTTPIQQISIRSDEDWRGRILRQLDHYRTKAPFYRETVDLVESALAIETDSITTLNRHALEQTCRYLRLPLRVDVWSEMGLPIDDVTHAGEWALNISKALNADEYINPSGGVAIFREEEFASAGIALRFLSNNLTPYDQRRDNFEAGLSIIDVLMFNEPQQALTLIEDARFIGAS